MKTRTRTNSRNQMIATIIETTPAEIEEGTGIATGNEVAIIEVAHLDGSVTRFFISLRIKRERAICEVASNNPKGGTSSRRLVGHKWLPAHSRERS